MEKSLVEVDVLEAETEVVAEKAHEVLEVVDEVEVTKS
jgi:hypothetical protein